MHGTVKTLAEFDQELKEVNLSGEWFFDAIISGLTDGPKPAGVPYLWDWKTMHDKLLTATEVIPQSFTARRTLNMLNPGLPRPGTTHTLVSSIQMVLPGEIAWAHRHSFNAIRFVIDGSSKLYTAVSGENFVMETGDLILNPNWAWHDHHNEATDHGVWLDLLDVPLGFTLNQPFYETFGQSVHPLLPDAPGHPYRFAWRDALDALYALQPSDASRYAGIEYEYVDPQSGRPVMPTFGCYLTRFPAGFRGLEQRMTSSEIYHVVRGHGTTIVDGKELHWGERDTFAIPNWTRHHHVNASASDDAILFKASDRNVLAALGFFREERAGMATAKG